MPLTARLALLRGSSTAVVSNIPGTIVWRYVPADVETEPDTAEVAAWHDTQPTERDLFPADTTSRPDAVAVLGRQVPSFDGVADLLLGEGAPSIPGTIYLVMLVDEDPTATDCALSQSSGGANPAYGIDAYPPAAFLATSAGVFTATPA